jgi:hypothetical protein
MRRCPLEIGGCSLRPRLEKDPQWREHGRRLIVWVTRLAAAEGNITLPQADEFTEQP